MKKEKQVTNPNLTLVKKKLFGLVSVNLTLPREEKNIHYYLYPTIEDALDAAVKWCEEKQSKNIVIYRKDSRPHQYHDAVEYYSHFGNFHCELRVERFEMSK